MTVTKQNIIENLEIQFFILEQDLIHEVKLSGKMSVPISAIPFRGGESALVLHINGDWSFKSAVGSYKINNPTLNKILEKFALLTDREFQETVGDSNSQDWDCERMRLRALENMLQEKYTVLLKNLIDQMREVYRSLKGR